MADVRPAGPRDFDQVFPLLLGFGHSAMSRDDWRRMLFDLPWPVEEPHRGYILYEGGAAVGFLGTIFSTREIAGVRRRFCNLSCWIVRESHRSASFQLVLPVLALRTHTIVNLSASQAAHEIFRRLGFSILEDHQVLIPPLGGPGDLVRLAGAAVTTRLAAIREALDEQGRALADHMAGTLAGQAVLRRGRRSCHIVATRSPWKRSLRLAHVQYASDWPLLFDHLAAVSWAFARAMGTVGLRVDGRHVAGHPPALAAKRSLALPMLYRPADSGVTPGQVDGLYTEAVGLRW